MFFAGTGGGEGVLRPVLSWEGEVTKSSKSSREQDIDERGDRSRSKESSDSGLRTDAESDGTCERR